MLAASRAPRGAISAILATLLVACAPGSIDEGDGLPDDSLDTIDQTVTSGCTEFGCGCAADWSWLEPVVRVQGGSRTCGRGTPRLLDSQGRVKIQYRPYVAPVLRTWLDLPNPDARETRFWAAIDQIIDHASAEYARSNPLSTGGLTAVLEQSLDGITMMTRDSIGGCGIYDFADPGTSILRWRIGLDGIPGAEPATSPIWLLVERQRICDDARNNSCFSTPGRVWLTLNDGGRLILMPPSFEPFHFRAAGRECIAEPTEECPVISHETYRWNRPASPARGMPVWIPANGDFTVNWGVTVHGHTPVSDGGVQNATLVVRRRSGAQGYETPEFGTQIPQLDRARFTPGSVEWLPDTVADTGGYFWVQSVNDIYSPLMQSTVSVRIDVAHRDTCGRPSACHGATTRACSQVPIGDSYDFCTIAEDSDTIWCPVSGTSQQHDQCCADQPTGIACNAVVWRRDSRGRRVEESGCGTTAERVRDDVDEASDEFDFFDLALIEPEAGIATQEGSPLFWQPFHVNDWIYRPDYDGNGEDVRSRGAYPTRGTLRAPAGIVFERSRFSNPPGWCQNLVYVDAEDPSRFMCGQSEDCLQSGGCPGPGGGGPGGGPGGPGPPRKSCGSYMLGDVVCEWERIDGTRRIPESLVYCGVTEYTTYAGYPSQCHMFNVDCDWRGRLSGCVTGEGSFESIPTGPDATDAAYELVDHMADYNCYLTWLDECDDERD